MQDGKIDSKFFPRSNACRELIGINGEPIEFEWNCSQIHWMSMFNDKDWTKKIVKSVFRIPKRSRSVQKKGFRVDSGHSSAKEKTKKWNGTYTYKVEGKWNSTAAVMLDILKESGQPTFRGSSALNRGVLKRKCGRCTNQLTVESTNTELLFRSSNSANQLSIHGAVASWCDDLAEQILGQTHMVMEKFVSQANKQFHQTWSRKKCILSCRHRGGTMEQETACVIVFNILKNGQNEVKFTKACESAGFISRVSKGMHHKTIHCVNGGFWR